MLMNYTVWTSCRRAKSLQSGLLATSWTTACQAPLSTGFSRQKYWSGFPCPPPGDFPDPAIKLGSPASPAFQAGSLPRSHQGRLICYVGRGNSHSSLADVPHQRSCTTTTKGCLSSTDTLRLGQLAGRMTSLQTQ